MHVTGIIRLIICIVLLQLPGCGRLEICVIAHVAVFAMRIVPCLDIGNELSDRHVAEVRVLVQHDQVFHDFVEGLFTALEERCFYGTQGLLVHLPQI